MKKGTLITLILALGFVGFLLYSTLSAQQVECAACVTFNGQTNCATASAVNEEEALRTAVNTACGTITSGMAESIQCGSLPPERPRCTTK
jgi:hypothetical protein